MDYENQCHRYLRQELSQGERLVQLNSVAITQMKSLMNSQNLSKRLNK
ncbi:MAG: hypothetical protein LBB73_08280 [Dysgonamonadaceae bacterium]|nr:hypothetical protein [Dysgonamonadaceae bacterium]